MKKNIYHCQTCSGEIKTANRDQGVAPMMMKCRAEKCEGMAMSSFYMVDQDIEPDLVFISPKNEKEWNAIRDEGTKDIMKMFPDKKPTKIEKMLERLIGAIKEHTDQGGIVELPKHIVDEL